MGSFQTMIRSITFQSILIILISILLILFTVMKLKSSSERFVAPAGGIIPPDLISGQPTMDTIICNNNSCGCNTSVVGIDEPFNYTDTSDNLNDSNEDRSHFINKINEPEGDNGNHFINKAPTTSNDNDNIDDLLTYGPGGQYVPNLQPIQDFNSVPELQEASLIGTLGVDELQSTGNFVNKNMF